MIKVLMIEDNIEFAELTKEYLLMFDILVENYDDPFLALKADIASFDLVLLDLTLPGLSGFEVCTKILKVHKLPIIISSSRYDIEDKVMGLNIGASDYMVKPYDPKELHARILSQLKPIHKPSISADDGTQKVLEINEETQEITLNTIPLKLTPAEYALLYELMRHRGSSVSKEQLFSASDALKNSSQKSLEVLVSRLRKKLDDKQKTMISSVPSVGYRLNA